MSTRGRETQDMGNTGLTLLPPHRTPYTIQRGGGGALEAFVPGPTAERGARAAMAGQGTRAAMADPGARAAMAEQGTRAAMADPGIRGAMVDQWTLWPWPGHTGHGYIAPPQKKLLGRSVSWGHSGSADSWGRCRGAGTGGRCRGAGTGLGWAATIWFIWQACRSLLIQAQELLK